VVVVVVVVVLLTLAFLLVVVLVRPPSSLRLGRSGLVVGLHGPRHVRVLWLASLGLAIPRGSSLRLAVPSGLAITSGMSNGGTGKRVELRGAWVAVRIHLRVLVEVCFSPTWGSGLSGSSSFVPFSAGRRQGTAP